MSPTIGKPGMIGVGPGQNLRKKSFESLQKEVKRVVDYLKGHPQPTLADIKGFLQHLELLKKDVKLYCGTFSDTKEYQACYDRALAIMSTLSKLTDANKYAATCKAELPKLNRQMVYMAHATYFEPKVQTPPVAPPRPATAAPAGPPRPTSASPTKK